jgi:hypothetical protein
MFTFVETRLFSRIVGGVRIIYYLKRANAIIWLLTIYAKSETENLAPSTLRKIKDEIDD